MALAGKLFRVEGGVDADLHTIAAKLKGFKSEEELKENGKDVRLVTEIKDLRLVEDSLYDSALGNTSMYADHLKYGKIWYVALRSKRHGAVVGVTRNGEVTIFSKATKDDFINYVREGVIGLI